MAQGIAGLVPEGWNTRSMLGKKVGRSVVVIKRMERDGEITPTGEMQCGAIVVKLYHDRDVPKVREAVRRRKPGKPPTTGKLIPVDGRTVVGGGR